MRTKSNSKTKSQQQVILNKMTKKPTVKSTKVQPQKSKTDTILEEIKKKERKEKIQEQKKLKIQEQRSKIYKDTSDPNRFYVTNKGLMAELEKWRDSADNNDDRIPSEELGKMFLAIAYKLTNHSYFRNYSKEIKEDCVSYAMEKCVTGIKNYNFKFKNPFAYFTQSCFNSFKTVLSKHYKQINIKRSLMKKIMTDIESDMPNSGMKKCLDNRFANDDYYDCEG